MGEAQAEAKINMAMAARRVASKRQRAGTQDSQLMRAVQRENTRVHRVHNDAYERFLERHVQDMEEDLRQRDQRGFQRFTSLNIEDTWKVSSQNIRDEEGIMLRDPGLSSEGGHGSSAPFSTRNPRSSDLTSSEGSPSGLSHPLSGSNRQKTS